MAFMDDDFSPSEIPGVLETGIWCNACFLPSAARVEMTAMIDGVESVVGEMTVCIDCDARLDREGNPYA